MFLKAIVAVVDRCLQTLANAVFARRGATFHALPFRVMSRWMMTNRVFTVRTQKGRQNRSKRDCGVRRAKQSVSFELLMQ